MASFHVHADQENQNSHISRLKDNRNRTGQVTQKRYVLGILDSNTSRANTRTLKVSINHPHLWSRYFNFHLFVHVI